MLQENIDEVRFAITDVETTGRSAANDRITEVAVVLLEGGELVAEHSSLINPQRFIPSHIQQLTGITNGMVALAPGPAAIYPTIRSWFGDHAVFTAHNVQFDHSFLQFEFDRNGVRGLDNPKLCTLRLARRLLPSKRGFSLDKLARHLGVSVRNRHRALGDALVTAKVLQILIGIAKEEHACESLEDLIRLQYRSVLRPANRSNRQDRLLEFSKGLAEQPGVYRMISKRGQLLYVGKAKSLRERVSTYFRRSADHSRKIREMVSRVDRIDVVETGSELAALLLESRMIKEEQPKYNSAGKRIRRYGFLRIDLNENYPRFEFSPVVSNDGAEYFGPFRNRDAAEMVLDVINQSFQLRRCEGAIVPDADVLPCLYHYIGRCLAPCAMIVREQEYRQEIDRVCSLLSGNEQGILDLLHTQMSQLSELLRFEEAAQLRDRIRELQRVFVWKRNVSDSVNNSNLVVCVPLSGGLQLRVYFVQYGMLVYERSFGPRFPGSEFRTRISRIFFDDRNGLPEYDRIEIDQIRMISSYLSRNIGEGFVLEVGLFSNPEELVREIGMRAKELLKGEGGDRSEQKGTTVLSSRLLH